jgi:hypothetical protein
MRCAKHSEYRHCNGQRWSINSAHPQRSNLGQDAVNLMQPHAQAVAGTQRQ